MDFILIYCFFLCALCKFKVKRISLARYATPILQRFLILCFSWSGQLNRTVKGQLELVWAAELDSKISACVNPDSSFGQRKIEVAVQIDGRLFLL